MAEDLISEYVDRNGVRGDTDFILSALREVYAEFKKLESIRVDLKGLNGLSGLSPVLSQAKAGTDALATAVETVGRQMDKTKGQTKELYQNTILYNKSNKEAAATNLLNAKASVENAKAKQIEAKATNESNKAKAAEQKLNDQAIDDYFQLSRAYNEAANKAKNYVLRLGENHPIAVQAVKDANDLSNVLKKVDASVGQNQRNVGNYKSAFDGLGFSFAQVGRELPSLAINMQTFFLAISNNLPTVADELKKATEEIKRMKAEGKETPSLFQRIGKALFSFQTLMSVGITLLVLYGSKLFGVGKQAKQASEYIDDFANSVDNALRSVNRYLSSRKTELELAIERSKRFGKTEAEQSDIRIKGYKEESKEFKALYEQKNVALSGFAKQIDDITGGQTKFISEYDKQFNGGVTQAFNILSRISDLKISGVYDTLNKKNKESVDALEKSAEKVNDLLEQSYSANNEAELENERKLNKLAEDAKANSKKRLKDALDAAKDAKEAADAQLQFEFEIQALELQRTVDFNKEIADDEKKSLLDRLIALRHFYDASGKLIDLNAELQKKLGTKTAKELELVTAQQHDAIIRLEKEFRAQRSEIQRQSAEKQSEQEKKLQSDLAKGIEEAYKRFAKAEEERTKKQKEEADKRLKGEEDLAKRRFELEQQLSTELQNLAFTVLTANIERQKNAIQEQIDLLNERKQKEIEVANQTIANAQDRAAAITTIEARAAAQKEQLEKKQRDLDIKKAQFDKAQAIVRIVQETAIGIIKATAALQPQLIPLIVAIGAAQLATVIAQPIPRYKHGKNVNDDYEGPAIVGDGGRKEAIIREDGSLEITADKPQLTYVKSRDVVLPDVNQLVNYVLAGNMGGSLIAKKSVPNENELANEVKAMRRDIVNAIHSQPKLSLSSNEAGLAAMWKYGANQTKYINEQTNW